MHKSERNRRLGLAQIYTAVLLAGGAGLFGKLLSASAADLTAGRTVFGSIALLLYALVTKQNLRLNTVKDFGVLAGSGCILALHWYSFFHSIQISTVAIGLLAFSTFPLFTTFLEPLVFGERIQRRDGITALIVATGLTLVTPSFDFSNRLTQGLLWGILSAFAYALLSLLSRSSASRYAAASISFYQKTFAALCTMPFALQGQETISVVSPLYSRTAGVS